MYYLAYGMNTNLEQMHWRCPAAKSLGSVVLRNHKLAFKGCCDVVHTEDSVVECALWDITPACEEALDMLEGYPNFYGKKEVKVKYKNKTIRAMIYYMRDVDKLSYPSSSYLKMVTEGYMDHDMSIDQIYRAIEEVDSVYYA